VALAGRVKFSSLLFLFTSLVFPKARWCIPPRLARVAEYVQSKGDGAATAAGIRRSPDCGIEKGLGANNKVTLAVKHSCYQDMLSGRMLLAAQREVLSKVKCSGNRFKASCPGKQPNAPLPPWLSCVPLV
jgi:hypothetical protein